jgi:hypothetical protein
MVVIMTGAAKRAVFFLSLGISLGLSGSYFLAVRFFRRWDVKVKLREKKKVMASRVLNLIYQKLVVEAVGGEDGYYLTQLRLMISGEEVRYTSEMNWLKIDFLGKDPHLREALDELSYIDAKLKILGWIPWL